MTSKLFLFLALFSFSMSSHAHWEAHEWGTFTCLVGANGITQNGMYHEDEPLPPFVHGFGEAQPHRALSLELFSSSNSIPCHCCHGRCSKGLPAPIYSRNVVTQKMETPVIYFYSDRAERVDVNVQFPEGVITETFPAPVQTSPLFSDRLELARGNTSFSVDVLSEKSGALPAVEPGNIYSHARNVNSNLIRSGNETEKFIFYRGLGRFQPRLAITSAQGNLQLSGPPSALPPAAFLVHVNGSGHGQMLNLGELSGSTTVTADTLNGLRQHDAGHRQGLLSGAGADAALISALTKSGLYRDEATAMLETWKHGYLQIPGLRLLYILPRAEVDEVLPLAFTPAPAHLERVFVGRIEILLDSDETRLLQAIAVQMDHFDISSLGRFSESILRRLAELPAAQEPALHTVLVRLINQAVAASGSVAIH